MLVVDNSQKRKKMPDIANCSKENLQVPLDRVGMTSVQLPLNIEQEGKSYQISAKADLFVNLAKKEAKGIHMSRLFLKAQEAFEKKLFSLKLLEDLLKEFVSSHKDLSTEAYIRLNFDYMTIRQALLSDFAGWRSYPIVIEAKYKNEQFSFDFGLDILYSSTCPCSAALSRQLIQDHFKASFTEETINKEELYAWLGKSENIVATPHSQRSQLKVKLRFDENKKDLSFMEYIDLLEKTLATPVQTAVKREDEQEFARLNASNLMFCEDAARKIHAALNSKPEIKDFWLKVDHKESLHPHNAVSITTKGIEGGFQA